SPIASAMIRIPAIQEMAEYLAKRIGDRPTVFLIIVFFRMLYYFIFEMALGMTPAKMLSETRVADENGGKPPVGKIARRTLLRLVPFESLTFFMPLGLHDRSSETYVVNEKRTGVKGSWYFLIIPIFLVAGTATWLGIYKYKQFQASKKYEAQEKQDKEVLADKIKNITSSDVIRLKAVNYDSEDIYLKAENSNSETVDFLILDPQKGYAEASGKKLSPYQTKNYIEKIYEIEKKNPSTISFSKSELISSEEHIKDQYNLDKKKGLNVMGKQFYISEIETYFGPRFTISGTSESAEKSYVTVQNDGWPAQLISVSDWKLESGQLPLMLSSDNYNNAVFSGKKADGYSFAIKVKDTLDRLHTYEISKKENLEAVVKKIK
ncbi:MAG TPA: RDD family protein, partial [Flavobacterium sp.]|nr:RDD family protein [Flavobacterium sp.]